MTGVYIVFEASMMFWSQFLQTGRHPYPAGIWHQFQSVCCCCQLSRPGGPLSPSCCSPFDKWSHQTLCRHYWNTKAKHRYKRWRLAAVDTSPNFSHSFPPVNHFHFLPLFIGMQWLTRWCEAGSRRPCIQGRSCSGSVWIWKCQTPTGSRPASPRSPAQQLRGRWDRPCRSPGRSPRWRSHACSQSSVWHSSSYRRNNKEINKRQSFRAVLHY